uniref:Astacin domain-containing protein n=1 Tax=Strongyloides papillosus TaxID=174720 RepID=A0A0N5CI72_STREA
MLCGPGVTCRRRGLRLKVNGGRFGLLEEARLIYPPYPNDTQCIQYYVDYDDKNKLIEDVFNTFKSPESCLCFKKVASKIEHEIGINFYKHKDEINALLSYGEKKPTDVYLKEDELTNLKKIAFGVGLAFGFIPEVERTDRDDNIEIDFEKIKVNYKKYYNEKIFTNTTTDFDFSSMMLYDFSFGATKKNEVVFKSKLYPHYENMRKNINYYISHNDKRRLNEIYCSGMCIGKPLCKNGGYYSDNYCNICTCPFGFKGRTCEELDNDTCKDISKKDRYAEEDPGYLELSDVEGKCVFHLKSNNENGNIIIDIKKIEFGGSGTPDKNRFIEIKYRDDKGTKGLTIYEDVSDIRLPSLSKEVYIITNDAEGKFDLDIEYHLNVTETGTL